jgi:CheY-like chemotaxis protein
LGIDVIDTGVGIQNEELECIFQPFSQGGRIVEKNYGGSGLGLAVTKGILQALRGEISVRSTPGHGSIFSVTVPCTPLNAELVLSDGTDQEAPFKKVDRSAHDVRLSGKVLIADDTPATRELLEGLFRFAGAQVCAVKDGACALEQGAREKYDLIIMDAEMPVVNGYEAMEQLRARGVTVPIIAVTAHIHRDQLQKCIASGATQFVSKASSMDQILFSAEQFIGVVAENAVYKDLLSTDSPHAKAVMSRAKLKYLARFERSMGPLKDAVHKRKWGRVGKILHPLSSAKMFGFTHVTGELRSIAMVLHRLLQNEKEAIGQIEQLSLLEGPLEEARKKIEIELQELERNVEIPTVG